jgi:hypothetical protein
MFNRLFDRDRLTDAIGLSCAVAIVVLALPFFLAGLGLAAVFLLLIMLWGAVKLLVAVGSDIYRNGIRNEFQRACAEVSIALLLILTVSTPTWAATSSSIDISPITNALLAVAGTALLAVGTWAVGRAARWMNLQSNATAVSAFDDALGKALAAGLQSSSALIAQKGWDHIDVKNATLAAAAPILVAKFPDALKGVGIDVSDPSQTAAKVTAALDRAFPAAVTKAAASPATPPVKS